MILQKRLEKILSEKPEIEKLAGFFQIIKENLFQASQNYHRNLIAFIVLIIAFILSSFWVVKDGNLPLVNIKEPDIIKSIFPGLIGYSFYVLCCYASAIEHLRVIYDEVAKQLFPNIAANNLLDYLKPVYPFLQQKVLHLTI